jgi:Ca2+-binding RTX toxin-like protein
VLEPDHPSTSYDHTFLYALPVEAGLAQSTWGSGLDELQKLDVPNQYNATIIEPIFPIYPWYADSSTDATINFETFMSTLLPAWVDSNFDPSGADKDLLIGFSKSGYGALDLLLKHPDVFADAAAWDFPADMVYNDYGSAENYGTEANFQDNYQLSGAFIDAWKAPFTTEDRIWISGSDVFQSQVSDFDTLLTSHGVLHTVAPSTHDDHNWSSGWLSDAVAGLYELVDGSVLNGSSGGQTLTAGSGQTTLIGGPNDILNGGAGADTFVFKADFGSNTVNNFTPAADVLEFSQSMFASVAAVFDDAQQVGADVVITHDALNVVTLHNTQLADLHASNFHIV